jgi:putative aldouronate transport system substrate-binding protein
MSADANDEISKIMTPINTYISEQELKFISGQRPMSEWNDYIAQIGKMGDIQKVIGYYNSGRQYPMGDRTYPTLPPDLK